MVLVRRLAQSIFRELTVIVDSHAHVFPHLAGPCGFPTTAEHLRFLQLYIAGHSNPVRRLRDHAVVEGKRPLSGPPIAPDRLLDVSFRVGKYGRFEWTVDGEEYYLSFLPPSMQELESPPEFLLQQMAHAGVDRVVLQNAHLYGRLEDYFAAAVRSYPDKFIALAGVDESQASEAEEIRRLRASVRELGMRGLYYANRGLFQEGYRRFFDDESFEPYWQEVVALGIPVFWEIGPVPEPSRENLLREIDRLNRWAERHPTIPCLYTHGFAPDLLQGDPPEPVARLLRNEQFMVEILYPIHWARDHQYPFAELRPVLRTLYDAVGAHRLVWGSDIPNVERNCTYKQALEYLYSGLDFVPPSEMDRILGGNVLRLMRGE